ncbi:MAG: hypothetical protein U0804_13825 [Gemmataceae bacterium]
MKAGTVHLVRRLVLYGDSGGVGDDLPELTDTDPRCNGVRRWQPVAAFATRAEAEADATDRNRAACELVNPVWVLPLLAVRPGRPRTAFDPRSTPAEFGVVLPPQEEYDTPHGGQQDRDRLARWYDEHAPDWPTHVRSVVWHWIAWNVGFYDVVEIELAD